MPTLGDEDDANWMLTDTSLLAPLSFDEEDHGVAKPSCEQTITKLHLPLVLDDEDDEESDHSEVNSDHDQSDEERAAQKTPSALQNLMLPVLASPPEVPRNVTRSISMPVAVRPLNNVVGATLHPRQNKVADAVPMISETAIE